jgi:hypothetical protein
LKPVTAIRAEESGYDRVMAAETQLFHPGQIVPESGIYRCAGGHDEHVFESTDIEGRRFPPLPRGCTGSGWVLTRAAHHHHH